MLRSLSWSSVESICYLIIKEHNSWKILKEWIVRLVLSFQINIKYSNIDTSIKIISVVELTSFALQKCLQEPRNSFWNKNLYIKNENWNFWQIPVCTTAQHVNFFNCTKLSLFLFWLKTEKWRIEDLSPATKISICESTQNHKLLKYLWFFVDF